jgi:hypothetical protein
MKTRYELLDYDIFEKLMARLNAAFPEFKPEEVTWEEYWESCKIIPERYLEAGVIKWKETGKPFFPKISELLMACVGDHFSIVPYERAPSIGDTTLDHILHEYKLLYEQATLRIALPEPERLRLEDKNAEQRETVDLGAENARLKSENTKLVLETIRLRREIAELRRKPSIDEKRSLLRKQAAEIGVTRDEITEARLALLKEQALLAGRNPA